ncbi:MgtC/SapB family protein [Wansuia hejianensis]|uniref:MgtC/SapB family protein n=1 Tax=Wansuia hejianensis TaxID=2763667 RepID=A0A926II85_9FIRM|nr:MgtC/SapB family protein [Wansuia hejianensis]MBC8591477.1 MgtC/SapB family protein [Wansuia hejianensis]
MLDYHIIIIRLILASILGGLIGLERESSNRPAGFRTHILVAIGSTLLMMVSFDSIVGADPARVAAQVVSGIGFLGAGTILRTGNNIEGLTTAASLWVCGAIGLSIGSGYYIGGITTTILVLFFLRSSRNFDKIRNKKSLRLINIICNTRPGIIGEIGTILGKYHIVIKDISILAIDLDEDVKEEIHFSVKIPHNIDLVDIFQELYNIEEIYRIELDYEEIKRN